MSNFAAIPLDMFTTLIAVHWPENDITKLDFVGNRYMVRGKDQDFEDVLGDEAENMDSGWTPGATQRSWRTEDGLDLRMYDDFGLSTGAKKAYIKNKIPEPTKKTPGALNEFLFLNSTVVMEFDWVDVVAAIREQSGPGSFPDGWDAIYDVMTNAAVADDQYLTLTNTEKQLDRDGLVIASMFWSYSYTGASYIDEAGVEFRQYVAVSHFEIGTEADWGGAVPAPGWGTDPFYNNFFPNVETAWYIFGSPPEGPYTIQPELALYELGDDSPPIDGRIIGAHPDIEVGSYAPMTSGDGTLQAPYGRVRIAFNYGPKTLAASVNGGDVVSLPGDPLFTRQPPMNETGTDRLKYFPVEDYLGGNFRTYEVFWSFPGIVRCVWLYRKRKKDKALKALSVIRDLTPPDSPKWKTT